MATSIDPSILMGLLQGKGLSTMGAAALTARAGAESSYNPAASGDNGTSYGLWQFHGPRKDALMSYAQNSGLDPSDPKTQAGYLAQELGSSEKMAGGLLGAAQTPEQGAAGAMAFERPQGWSADNPSAGLGYGKTLSGIQALLAGNGGAPPPSAAPAGPNLGLTAGAAPDDGGAPSPIQTQPLAPVQVPSDPAMPAMSLLGGLDLPRAMAACGGGIRPIASILGRRI